ncbi:hypothetical protein ACFL24_02780 [Patescibacteria group bacterium]
MKAVRIILSILGGIVGLLGGVIIFFALFIFRALFMLSGGPVLSYESTLAGGIVIFILLVGLCIAGGWRMPDLFKKSKEVEDDE